MMEMPAPDGSRTTLQSTRHCAYAAARTHTLKQVILLEKILLKKILLLFVLPGNIYHQLNVAKESILLLNMLGHVMLPANRVLGCTKTWKR